MTTPIQGTLLPRAEPQFTVVIDPNGSGLEYRKFGCGVAGGYRITICPGIVTAAQLATRSDLLSVPGIVMFVRDMGPAPTVGATPRGILVMSNGSAWVPCAGMAVLYKRAGSIASPLATLTLAAAAGIFTLPETLAVPTALMSVGMTIGIEAQVQRGGTAAGTGVVRALLGNLNSGSDNAIDAVSMAATVNLHLPRLVGSAVFSSASNATTHTGNTADNQTATNANAGDISSNMSQAATIYGNLGVTSGTVGDIFNLINYKLWIEA